LSKLKSRTFRDKEIVLIDFSAKQLSCTNYQIKNWFANKRKKLRFFIPDPEAPQIEIPQQVQCLPQGPNSMTDFSTLLSSYFKARSSIVSQIDANNQRIQDIQHLRAQFAQNTLSSNQNYIQEISRLQRLQGLQASVYPSNFFTPFSAGTNLTNGRMSLDHELSGFGLSKSSQIRNLQAEARSSFNIALTNQASFKTQ